MDFATLVGKSNKILTECAVAERLRRAADIESHPTLFHTPMIYDEGGAAILARIYGEYRKTAEEANLPMLLCAPTWRVDRMRVYDAGYDHQLVHDAVNFMQKLAQEWKAMSSPLFIGGLIGPKNDCYSPELGLSAEEAKDFHSWQADHLAEAGVECIVSQTMPAVEEALGMADALAATDLPYIISFVIDRNTAVLDGIPLAEAMKRIDDDTPTPPLGYMVNCVYPSFLRPAEQPEGFFERLIGIQANSSSLDHDQLDGADSLHQDSLEDWGERMLELNSRYGVKILGGCCGTDNTYLRYLGGLHQPEKE